MIPYPKIQTVFKRDDKGNILPLQITRREFEVIKEWTVTEKIDGMNIRVGFSEDFDGKWKVEFEGKTDNAQIPINLLNHLYRTFKENLDKFVTYFKNHDDSVSSVQIFGEGYGAGIQKGSGYSKEQKFIAFDMYIDGWWLEPLHAKSICDDLGVPFVPVLDFTSKEDIIEFIQSKPKTHLAPEIQLPDGTIDDSALSQIHDMEGAVATSRPLMLFRDGTPIKFKLKAKDYKAL